MNIKINILMTVLLTVITYKSNSQNNFSPGYFIDNDNNRHECLINKGDKPDNPSGFEYKLMGEDDVYVTDVNHVSVFQINEGARYIRAIVNVDQSSNNVGTLSKERNPIFIKDTLFLKVLVEGQASLYSHEQKNRLLFFYQTKTNEIEQLIYKRYIVINSEGVENIGENRGYRQQLFNDFSDANLAFRDINRLSYSRKQLERLFITYNGHKGANYIIYKTNRKKLSFNMALRPRMSSIKLDMHNTLSNKRVKMSSDSEFSFGLEGEFVIPYYNQHWSLLFEPTYQSFKGQNTLPFNDVLGGVLHYDLKYHSIELPVSIRYHLPISKKSKLFGTVSYYIFDFEFESGIMVSRHDGSLMDEYEIQSKPNYGFGIGYRYNNRYSVELKYQTSRDLLSQYLYWNSNYNTMSVIFGVALF